MKDEKTEKQGIQGKRLKAAWNNQYLPKILNVKVSFLPVFLFTFFLYLFFLEEFYQII